MFVYYYDLIPMPFTDVERRTTELLGGLPEVAELTYREGHELRAQLQTDQARLAKAVRLTVGAPLRRPGETNVPIAWEATGAPALFPRLDGELVLAEVGDSLTHLSLRGSYRVPLGPVGRLLDRMVLHRIAESTIKNFVDQVASLIQAERQPHSGSPLLEAR